MVLTHNSKKDIPWSQDNLLPCCPVVDAHVAFVRPVVWDPYLGEPVTEKGAALSHTEITTHMKMFDCQGHRLAHNGTTATFIDMKFKKESAGSWEREPRSG